MGMFMTYVFPKEIDEIFGNPQQDLSLYACVDNRDLVAKVGSVDAEEQGRSGHAVGARLVVAEVGSRGTRAKMPLGAAGARSGARARRAARSAGSVQPRRVGSLGPT